MELIKKGPVFLIGMPRSGTKLLRDLLNRNDQIFIPRIESHFIPLFLDKYRNVSNIKNNIDAFIEDFQKTSFYYNSLQDNFEFIKSDLVKSIHEAENWSDIIKALLLQFTDFDYCLDRAKYEIYIGDKTPGYIKVMDLLNENFNDAVFIHLIRDPRDYCLSVKNVWGKSLLQAARKWSASINNLQKIIRKNKLSIIEVKYEDLIVNPEFELRRICSFLNIDFTNEMMSLDRPSGIVEGTSNLKTVKNDNLNKYKESLRTKDVRLIEYICDNQMKLYDYHLDNIKLKHITFYQLKYISTFIYDFYKMLNYHISKKGLFKGIRYYTLLVFENNFIKN